MHNKNDALLAVYRAGTKMEIDATKATGRPETFDFLPQDAEANQLLLMQREAAERDSILLYDGTDVYERHVDDLSLSDAELAAAYLDLAATALSRSAEQHRFAADVKRDIEETEAGDA
jgi:hypothetical protein